MDPNVGPVAAGRTTLRTNTNVHRCRARRGNVAVLWCLSGLARAKRKRRHRRKDMLMGISAPSQRKEARVSGIARSPPHRHLFGVRLNDRKWALPLLNGDVLLLR